MQKFHENFESFWDRVCEPQTGLVLDLEIVDLGKHDGIKVALYVDQPDRLVFEVILADPESRQLMTDGSIETETFWKCIRTYVKKEAITQLFLTARCNSSPMLNAVSARCIGYAEMRNVRFLRLVEDILDEVATQEPALSVDVVVTYRNPDNDHFVNYIF